MKTVPLVNRNLPVIWAPNPGPQEAFLSSPAFEALTGGARGGGKSEALIMDPLAFVHIPEFRGIFFRLTYPDLIPLIERTQLRYKKIFPDARWNQTEKCWRFPSGAKIYFRFLQTENDWIHYQGHEYHWMGFEELTQFTETQYINLIPSCRSTVEAIPGSMCYVRATCNPGGRGHHWVRARFIDPAPQGNTVISEPMRDPLTKEIRYATRAFYPSTFRDNPQLLKNDPEYVMRLMMLPPADRKAMMDGDWDAYVGNVFRFTQGVHIHTWEEFNTRYGLKLGNRKPPDHWRRYRVMDWGYAKPFSIQWFAVDTDGIAWLYREWYGVDYNAKKALIPNQGIRMEPQKVAARIKEIEKAAGEWDEDNDASLVHGIADPACWNAATGDHGGGLSIAEQMAREKVRWSPGKNDRIGGKMAVHDWLKFDMDSTNTKVVSPPSLNIIKGEAPHTLRTVSALEYDELIVEDIDTTMEDHAYDSLRYFCISRPAPTIQPEYKRRSRLSKPKGDVTWAD